MSVIMTIRTGGVPMTKDVVVTPAQVTAAKAMVARYKKTGRPVPEAFRLIAEATTPPVAEDEPEAASAR